MSTSKPVPRLTVITLGVSDMRASIAFYEALGFARKFRATGEAVAFFDTGGTVLGLFPGIELAAGCHAAGSAAAAGVSRIDAGLELRHRRRGRCGAGVRDLKGASLLKPAHETDYGGYSGYFADPDGHPWEVVVAPGIEVGDDRRVHLPD